MFPKLQFRGTHLYFSPRVQYVFHETFDSDERRNIVFVKEMIIIYFSNILNDFTVQGGACAHGSCQYKVNNYVFFSLSVHHFGVVYMIMSGTAFKNIVYLLHF
jgi:hypothetical protein